MKNYLSFGGGVNSVAMMLYLLDQGYDFEAVFVNHGTDWPETYEYFDMFQEWLDKRGVRPITVLIPNYRSFNNVYDYAWHYEIVPTYKFRWCTVEFKLRTIYAYCIAPAFMLIGIDMSESKRAKYGCEKGFENRFPLIEAEFSRGACKNYIKNHGLEVPQKSGCFICPYQKVYQWKELRNKHPELFCKAEHLEKRNMEYRKRKGKKPLFLNQSPKASLRSIVGENQNKLFERDKYPPCHCML